MWTAENEKRMRADIAASEQIAREQGIPPRRVTLTYEDAAAALAEIERLTAEQAADLRERAAFIAETCSGGDHTISNRDLIARRIRELPLRASRGETGPTWGDLAVAELRRATAADPPEPDRPSGLTSIMHDAAQRPSVLPKHGGPEL